MTKMPPRILFLCHSASRNGATILLLHLIQWLRPRVDWEIEVLVNGRGPLVNEFRSIVRTNVLRNPASLLGSIPEVWRNGLQRFIERRYLDAVLMGRRFDLVYANTSAAWPQVLSLRERAPALLWHIHELEYVLRLSMGKARINQTFPLASRFVATSKAVFDVLSGECNVPREKIDVIYGSVPFLQLGQEERRSRRQRILAKLNWPDDVFVVGGCGTLGWRKGTDLFLQVAHAVARQTGYEKVRFLWVGGEAEGQESLVFAHDAQALKLADRTFRIPTTADASEFYDAMDVFALTSREDPFPLVMLEAAASSLPIVCFADTGGGPEFVGEDAGLTAPYADTAVFAAHIMTLYDLPSLRERLGVAASNKVKAHHGMDSLGQKVLQSIQRCLWDSQSPDVPFVNTVWKGQER